MSLKRALLIGAPLIFFGCALHRPVPENQPSTQPAFQPLTLPQLLGLERPPGLIHDGDSGQVALRPVMESFWKLKAKAEAEGWHLILVSGYRSFQKQKAIWNSYDKVFTEEGYPTPQDRAEAIMNSVSVPGLSRHHWGTDLDISEKTLRGQLLTVDPKTPSRIVAFYAWMEQNAPAFGFCKIYRGDGGTVKDEPWHWSYLPYARAYQEQFMSIRDFSAIQDSSVDEMDYLKRNYLEIVNREIRSVNPACAP